MIEELARQGLTIREIAEHVGMNRHTVGGHISKMVLDGTLPPASDRKFASRTTKRGPGVIVNHMAQRYGLKVGNLGQILTALTTDQIEWLGRTVPEGLTLAQFCAAVLRDLHDEETA